MDPAARSECALMFDLVKLIGRPAAKTTALMAAVMSYPWICCHLLPCLKLEIDVSPEVPWSHRYATRRLMAATGNPWNWPLQPCPINYPLTPFFWVVNRRLTNSA